MNPTDKANDDKNIILIGMAGSGKSTVGKLLAEALKRPFIDTDSLIERAKDLPLQDILNQYGNEGNEYFLELENDVITKITTHNSVIATGGSVIYSKNAMEHLKSIGTVFFLNVPLEELKTRSLNLGSRGFIAKNNSSFDDIYYERLNLYQQFADITVDCKQKTARSICKELSKVT